MNTYDIIIVGGGIAGLYTAYHALKKDNSRTVLILEKESQLGGRIFTYHDFPIPIEFGAGRFHDGHIKLKQLIHDLGLSHLIVPIHNLQENDYMKFLLDTVIQRYHARKNNRFLGMSFCDYISKTKILDQEQLKFILDNYGYSAELTCMNMKDAMILIEDMHSHKYYGIKGGFSTIISNLEQKIIDMGGKIILNANIHDIQKDGSTFLVHHQKMTYSTNTCILAIPKKSLLKLSLLRPISKELDSIVTTPLCRIYTTYKSSKKSPIWFHNLPKQTVNNNLRIVIPLSEEKGVIMNSYTDSKYAKWWYRLWKQKGLNAVKKKIHEFTIDTFPWSENQFIDKIKIAYWEDGVAFWKPGITNSEQISKKINRPFGEHIPCYICGENYSEKQQWIESALINSPLL